jgi:2,4-didehydro-3-deoxy-L-rhamnonate hydrolase
VRLANAGGRAALLLDDEIADIATVSDGKFGPDLMQIYDAWPAFADWAAGAHAGTGPLVHGDLGCPVPAPRQIFAIGINYREHAEETTSAVSEVPTTFTKFASCLAGPYDNIDTTPGTTDWEVELVAVIGLPARNVHESEAWDVVAGLTIGQDISDRALQLAAGGQYSLGKSRPGYGPLGPYVVSLDEISNPDDLAIGCAIDGETMQEARTSQLIVTVPQLIAELSGVLPLSPGDIIFTGTPGGVGIARTPQRFLKPGQVLESWIEDIGTLRNPCI